MGVGQGQFLTPLFPLQFVLKNYGENPENYNEELRKLELLRQVSQTLSRIAGSPSETCQSQTGTSWFIACFVREGVCASSHHLPGLGAAAAAPLPHQWPTDEAFSSQASS